MAPPPSARLLVGIEQFPDLAQLVGRRTTAVERLDDELRGRAAEGPIQEVGDQRFQRVIFRVRGPIEMLPAYVLTCGEALLGHHLERLECRGIGDRLRFLVAYRVVHFTNG